MATKFHSKVVRGNEMGGKLVYEFKEKLIEEGNVEAVIDRAEVKLFDTLEEAEKAIEDFLG